MISTSENTVLQKSLEPMSPRPGLGHDNAARTRRIEGGIKVGQRSTKSRGEKFSPQKSLSPVFSSKKAARQEFAAVISNECSGDLATIANCSKETVKSWRKADGFPIGDKLMEMAAPGGNPTVRRYVAIKLGFMDPVMMDAMMKMQLGGGDK